MPHTPRRSAALLAACTAALLAAATAPAEASARAAATAAVRPGRSATASAFADWPEYHGGKGRTGYAATMPPASGTPTVTHQLTLDGAVYGSPIVVGGVTVVATENDTVYAFDANFHQLYKRHLGTPAQQSELPCGDIFPLGITGTPAYGAADNVVYVAAEFGSPVRHVLYALDFATGAVKWHRSLDLSGVETDAMQERGALTVVGDRVYVPFGGLAGDCGGYKGRVVGTLHDGSGDQTSYTVPTDREGGIWTTPGPTTDAHNHMFVAVGNGASGVGDPYDFSDSVLELGTKHLGLRDSFSPSTWPFDNDHDLDLGSMGPALVSGTWVFTAGKSGTAYVLRKSHLGGIGGEVSQADLCTAFGGTAVRHNVVYVPCTDGVRAVAISSTGTMSVLWHAASTIAGSPVIGGGQIWDLASGAGTLYALDPSTGAVVSQVSVGRTNRFASPSIYGPDIIVPTLTGITVVATS